MQRLFDCADRYLQKSDLKDIALIKLCLCAIGVLIGINLAPKYKKQTAVIASVVFGFTYVPLMTKFFKILFDKGETE